MRGKIHPMMCLDNDLQYDDHPDLNHYRMVQGNYSFCQLYFFFIATHTSVIGIVLPT